MTFRELLRDVEVMVEGRGQGAEVADVRGCLRGDLDRSVGERSEAENWIGRVRVLFQREPGKWCAEDIDSKEPPLRARGALPTQTAIVQVS